jgi:hypothetical protein
VIEIIEIYTSDYTWNARWGPDPATEAGFDMPEPAHCECCGKRIKNRVFCRDGDGKYMLLGLKCAQNAQTKGLERARQKIAYRDKDFYCGLTLLPAQGGNEEFRDWARNQPHPKGWEGKSLLGQLVWLSTKGKADAISKYWRQFNKQRKELPC